MGELGDISAGMHVQMGGKAHKCGISLLFPVGKMADKYIEGYGAPEGLSVYSAASDVVGPVLDFLRNNNGRIAVLVKGSHAVGLKKVVEAIKEAFH